MTAVVLKSLDPVEVIDPTTVSVVAHLSVRVAGETTPEAVTFILKREDDPVRIDDIVTPSLRASFRKSCGR
ncbi:hypothetical protein OPKNFCMD_5651 [Methylobacterium crusticola]|uniref:Uncharacterized protein n=1 Tax=Methylobacterium crusticola TaxID=1697972 RepID=A0ABQ4R6V5_9HYPH|nr:hypothetical protein [Methylobacterium crusticola]GJD52884.1 hypothetical protein OPKNFCMD_5651 [Methylobacterium crusticola]